MANTLKFGNGEWYGKKDTILAYNDENNNYKPLPFTFDRGSTATRVNKDGLIETVGTDEPRVDYLNNSKGALLLEPSRTNLVTYSEDFNQWGKINVTVTSNSVISPDGTQNADKLIATSGSSNKVINQVVSANTYTASVFAKKGEFEGLFIGTGTTGAFFNLNTYSYRTNYQSAPTSYKIEKYNNGWYRYSVTFTISSTDSIYIGPNDNVSTNLAITGDGSKGIYIYGAQLEVGSYPTSIIKTQGSAVTRSADVCNNAGNSNVFNDSEGVLFADVNFLTLTGGDYFGLNDGSNNQRVLIQRSTTNINIYINNAVNLIGATSSLNNKIAVSYKANDYKLYLNGTKVATNTSSSVTPSGLNAFEFELGGGFGLYFYGKVKDVRYYNTALSDSELQALTT